MNHLRSLIEKIIKTPEVRRKIFFTAAVFFVFRLLAHIPLPGVDVAHIRSIFAGNQLLNFLNIFSGGTLANSSVMAVGINPYITSSIVIQLATMVIPSLKEIQKDGESGREKINQYTRMLAVPVGVVQSVSILEFLRAQSLLTATDPLTMVLMITTLVAGSLILMWLGELVTQYGIGNGISMILFAGIVGQLPIAVGQLTAATTSQDYLRLAVFGGVLLGVIMLMVYVNEAVRKIQIQYAKRVRGGRTFGGESTHFPIRVNVTGVLPIIFAVSVMLTPSLLGRFLTSQSNVALSRFGQNLVVWFAQTSWIYMLTYFIIVFAFTFLSALVFFNAEDLAEELKKSGALVPGIRPGGPTKKFLEYVLVRITFIGALFLGFIAILPSLAQLLTQLNSLAIGGTSMLIVVSVVLETAKQVDGMFVQQNYDRFR